MEDTSTSLTTRKRSVGVTLVGIIAVLLLQSCSQGSENELKYPGNGIPLFSKDVPVKKLNSEMENFFNNRDSFFIQNSKIKFSFVKENIKFQSSYKIVGPTLVLKLPVDLEKGKIIVQIGDIIFDLSSNEYSIIQANKVLNNYKKKEFKGDFLGISIDRGYDDNKNLVSMARLWFGTEAGGGICPGDRVNLNLPASIKIEIYKDSIGNLGQWLWLRGYK